MTTITIKLPEELYEQLMAASERENRAVDEIAIAGIAREVAPSDAPAAPMTRDQEMQRLREALDGRVWTEHDVSRHRARTGFPRMTPDERQRVIASLPVLDPPLSETIIKMRDEERY